MKLFLENVCNIKRAEINIDGITVIAGPNNTGKSTVGKSLHLICKSFYNIEETIQNEKEHNIENILNELVHPFLPTSISNYIKEFNRIELKDEILKFENPTQKEIEDYLLDYLDTVKLKHGKDFKTVVHNVSEKINKALKITKKEYFRVLVSRILKRIFFSSITNMTINEETKISLNFDEKENAFITFKNNKIINEKYFNRCANVIYIETPFVFDDMNLLFYSFIKEFKNYYLIDQLLYSKEISVASEILREKKLDNILEKLNTVCPGKIITNGQQTITYRESETSEEIPIQNISTGIKSFLILKTLIQKGQLKDEEILILDEPEVHIHPQWQLIYAELIVLLQKEFNLHILLTTHSPYFIQAIEAYSKEHNIVEKCNYYLSKNEDNTFTFKNVTEDLEPVYKKFLAPLQIINSIEAKNA